MSDSASFVLIIAIVAVGCLLYTGLCKIAEAIKGKDIVKINNIGVSEMEVLGISKMEANDGFSVKFDGKHWVKAEYKKGD